MYLLKNFLNSKYDKFEEILNNYTTCQNNTINLTACTSYPFEEVLHVQSYPLSTLPTEGTLGRRFFPGSKCFDDLENFAEQETLTLFRLSNNYNVNIQANSGTQANQIVYNSILKDNDNVLALSPRDGGHISHSKLGCRNVGVYHFNLDDKLDVNYKQLKEMIKSIKPKLIIVGASSYPKEFDYKKIKELISNNKIYLMADICHSALYIIGNVHKPIFPYVDFATFTMDKTLRGPQGGIIIYKHEHDKNICESIFPKTQGGPIQNMMFAKSICLNVLNNIDVKQYAQNVITNTTTMINTFLEESIPLVCNEAFNHIILIDLQKLNISGKDAENILYQWKIIANRNQIPNDKKSPMECSGIRIGTTAITNLNYSMRDIKLLAICISQILKYQKTDISNINYLIEKYHHNINISS